MKKTKVLPGVTKMNLEEMEVLTAWSKPSSYSTPCSSCRKRGVSICKTPKDWLCATCFETVLRRAAKSEDLERWPVSRFREALSPEGGLHLRLTVLLRFKEVLQLVGEEDAQKLMALLVQNLGYVKSDPLALPVRQAARDICLSLDEKVLPLLLKMRGKEPWQFYVNVVVTARAIAPQNKEVQELIQEAACDPRPQVQQYLLSSIRKMFGGKTGNPGPGNLARGVIPSGKIEIPRTPKSLSPLEATIDGDYNADTLKRIYTHHLHHFFGEGANKLKKRELISALAEVYSDKDLFEELLSHLPRDVRETLNILVWEGGELDVKRLEKRFNQEIVNKERYCPGSEASRINANYLLFQFRSVYNYNGHDYYFYLSDSLRKLFKSYLPHPEEYDLIPLEAIKETEFTYEDNDRILLQIRLLVNFVHQGNLKFAQNQEKILKGSLKQMVNFCKISEFYEGKHKDLEYLKTKLMADFLMKSEKKDLDHSPGSLKELFGGFFNGKDFKEYEFRQLLSYVKGKARYYGYGPDKDREKNVRSSLFGLLRKLPVERWVSASNLIKYSIYRDIYLDAVERWAAANNLYYVEKYRYGYQNVRIPKRFYKDAVIAPFISATSFLFASFGILDIAYDLPKNETLKEKDKDYLSVFDGLKYIRLTKLGAYILGLAKDYEVKFEQEKANIVLDEKSLIINVEGRDRLKEMFLEKMADKIGEKHYRIDYNSFLKDCYSKKDVEGKVELFWDHVSAKPPKIWQDFLDEVLDKINPLTRRPKMAVYKLASNKELISLMARDEVLKKYIAKAEGYHILIEASNVKKVKKRLEEFGYFIDNI
ncbi:hypothetical protein KJ693_09045 [bacterium]|nr:hypothetical protein [bacterium]MBU1615438.1 hypothetical protein [bacterium]